jgi:hypothetical protein
MKKPSSVAAVATGLVLLTIAVSSIVSNRKLAGQVAAQQQFIEQREALIDSLHSELFIANVTIARTEFTLEWLREVNPPAFSQFSQYYDHETE